MVMFQVLVDSVGQGCVLSHTDVSNSLVTKGIIGYLNTCTWHPAIENGKPTRSSINILFSITDGKISGELQRVDSKAFFTNMRSNGAPTIYNKTYTYANPNLNNYEFTTWDKTNSALNNNLSQHCLVDHTGTLWYATVLDGLKRFDGKTFTDVNESNSILDKTASVSAMAIDKENNIWLAGGKAVYKYNNDKWEKYDSTATNISWSGFITTSSNGEVFFAHSKGLSVLKDGKWNLINDQNTPQLPANRVYYGYRDKQGRLWIGTFSGSIMIDPAGKITSYNNSETPLNDACIYTITEDESGNVYFALSSTKKHGVDMDEEGIAMLSKDGKWTHYNDKNSGMPANHVNSLFYDRFEKVLWISTHLAGLVRFDLKDGWENYNNKNSGVTSYDTYEVAQDAGGTLYVSTYNGLLRIARKK